MRIQSLLSALPCSGSQVSQRALGAVLVSLACLHSGSAQNQAGLMELSDAPYVAPEVRTSTPTKMEIVERGQYREYPAKATTEGVEIEIPAMGGAIFYPWKGLGEIKINRPITTELRAGVTEKDPAERARLLEPQIDPIIPFARIPPESTNVHNILEVYLSALVATSKAEAAYALSQKLPLDQIPPATAAHFYEVSSQLFSSEQHEKGLRLLNQLYAARPEAEFQTASLSLAEGLAEDRFFGPALSLYRPLVDVADEADRKEIALRGAYLALETGNDAAYEHFRTIYLQAPGESARLSAIQLILDGLLSLRNDDVRAALKAIGRALAIIPHDSGWKEIALYYNYESYRTRGEMKTAQTILDEMELLFPDGAYTAALKQTQQEN